LSLLFSTDWLARFIFSRQHYSPQKNAVKYGAFLPVRNSETSILEVSVFRISSIPDDQIWSIGEQEVAQRSGRTLRARADITLSGVQDKELRVDLDDIPLRHANITGWPEERSEQKLIAIELASSALLRLR
jgi:hypothetical protein